MSVVTDRPQRRGALGKGITSLLGDFSENTNSSVVGSQTTTPKSETSRSEASGGLLYVDVLQIEPNPAQPRKLFEEKALGDLAASLRQDGFLQPIVVSRLEETPGRYMIVAGERRWRASQLAGLKQVPVIVKEGAADDLLRLALIENIQRQDLNIIEEAEAYQALIKDYGLTQEQCADRVGKDRTSVTNALRLLVLPKELQDDLLEDRLTMGHGRALLSLEDKKLILRARDSVIKKQMSVRQTEQLCRSMKRGGDLSERSRGPKNQADLEYLSDNLKSKLRTKVKILGNGVRGKIEISYFSAQELERLLAILGDK
ncbi:MAG: ParB/RepB/Spo0J family partition protein [Proteobacteria bacterium]|nr:ParB/RepB/Spo0J family partition protein [Pseudomonadota bacterium]